MKTALILISFLSSTTLLAQNSTTTVEVKLYVPAHLKNTLTPSDKLTVYFLPLLSDSISKKLPAQTTAKKIKENIYRFQMPMTKLWAVGFSIGSYSYQMLCVDNKNGDANEVYKFDILLENRKYVKPDMLPPCINTDDGN